MKYCLDTNTVISYLKGTRPQLLERLKTHQPEEIAISELVRGELLYGVAKSQQIEKNRALLEKFLTPYHLLPFAGDTAVHYADIRLKLERQGTIIGPNDLIIAATARAYGAVLVTNNTSEFARVEGLMVEDWTV